MKQDQYSWVWVFQYVLQRNWIGIDKLFHHSGWWSAPLASTGIGKMMKDPYSWVRKWKDEAGIRLVDLGLASGLLRIKHDSFAM
jgi:hypothetical protein